MVHSHNLSLSTRLHRKASLSNNLQVLSHQIQAFHLHRFKTTQLRLHSFKTKRILLRRCRTALLAFHLDHLELRAGRQGDSEPLLLRLFRISLSLIELKLHLRTCLPLRDPQAFLLPQDCRNARPLAHRMLMLSKCNKCTRVRFRDPRILLTHQIRLLRIILAKKRKQTALVSHNPQMYHHQVCQLRPLQMQHL